MSSLSCVSTPNVSDPEMNPFPVLVRKAVLKVALLCVSCVNPAAAAADDDDTLEHVLLLLLLLHGLLQFDRHTATQRHPAHTRGSHFGAHPGTNRQNNTTDCQSRVNSITDAHSPAVQCCRGLLRCREGVGEVGAQIADDNLRRQGSR